MAQAHYYRGEYGRVVELTTGNLAALPPEWTDESMGTLAPVSVLDRVWLIVSLAHLGRFAEAASREAEVIRLAEPSHHLFHVSLAYFAAGTARLVEGDWEKARALVEHWIAVAREGNVAIHLPWAVASSAWILAQLGQSDEALARIGEGEGLLERQAARGVLGHLGWAYHLLGRASLRLGRLDEARRLAARAAESSPVQPGFAPHTLHLQGDVASHPGAFDGAAAEAHYRQALALAEARAMRPLVAHCHLGLGRLARRAGGVPQAREHLTTAAAMYGDMGMATWLAQAEAELRSGS
jgi:tetratricopeptide (TPR) repeat protein